MPSESAPAGTAIEVQAQTKLCARCGAPTSEFYPGRAMCKPCVRAQVKKARAANPEHYRQFDKARANRPDRVAARKAYQHTPEGKAAFYRATLNAIKRHPDKVKARDKVNKAIKDGRLIKQPCEKCGNPKVDAHHDDYGKPLEVRWLCLLHHKQHHGYMKEAQVA